MALLGSNVWRKLLGVDRATVIESIDFDEEAESVVVHVRPRRSTKRRCGIRTCSFAWAPSRPPVVGTPWASATELQRPKLGRTLTS